MKNYRLKCLSAPEKFWRGVGLRSPSSQQRNRLLWWNHLRLDWHLISSQSPTTNRSDKIHKHWNCRLREASATKQEFDPRVENRCKACEHLKNKSSCGKGSECGKWISGFMENLSCSQSQDEITQIIRVLGRWRRWCLCFEAKVDQLVTLILYNLRLEDHQVVNEKWQDVLFH